MEKFRNKYRIESNRLKGWDYAGNGIYFITLVTKNRECNLGHIENDRMVLSEFGKIVNDEWVKSFEMRNELFCDEYQIMPNHLHAIIILKKPANDHTNDMNQTHGADGADGTHGTHGTHVETHGRASLQSQQSQQSQQPQQPQQPQYPQQSPFFRKPKSISSFIGGFKSAVNSKIDDYIDRHHLDMPKYNRNNHFFQPNYHDHIIRNAGEYRRIKNYIVNNPKKWHGDTFNPNKKNTGK